MKKRILAMLLVLVMMGTIAAACTKTEPAPAAAPAAEATKAPEAQAAAPAEKEEAPAEDAGKPSREKTLKLKIGTNHSTGTAVALSCQKLADLVAEKTNGGVQIDVFPDGTLGSETELRDMCSAGSIDMAALGAGVYGAYVDAANLPVSNYVFRDEATMAAVLNGELGKKYINDPVEEVANIHTLYGWPQAARELLTVKPVNSIADIKGMKIRVPAGNQLYVDTWGSYGALPVALSMNECYTALEQGVIDGLEMPIDSLYTAGYHEVAKYLTMTNHMMYVQYVMINATLWNSLSAEEQAAFNEAVVEAGAYHNELRDANITKMVEEMKAKGVTVTEVDMQEWIDATGTVSAQWMDKWGQEVYDAFTSYAG